MPDPERGVFRAIVLGWMVGPFARYVDRLEASTLVINNWTHLGETSLSANVT
jgi:hypothetical protein